ncbi:MAG: hypothetical protein FWH03_02910 [Firmicutes bacterium]|nr:hypothetical protein [Bacillota bacterium]
MLIKGLKLLGKLFAFLLIKVGLWLPALFAFGFLIFCLVLNIPFTAVGAVRVFWIGLTVCTLLGIAWALHRSKKRAKTAAKKPAPRGKLTSAPQGERRTESRPQYHADNDYNDYDEKYEYNEKYEYDEGYSTKHQPRPAHTSADNRLQKSSVRPPEEFTDINGGFTPDFTHSGSGSINPDFSQRYSSVQRILNESASERPLVFATRKDPDILIVEFSDRLMFFKKRGHQEPELIATEYKNL